MRPNNLFLDEEDRDWDEHMPAIAQMNLSGSAVVEHTVEPDAPPNVSIYSEHMYRSPLHNPDGQLPHLPSAIGYRTYFETMAAIEPHELERVRESIARSDHAFGRTNARVTAQQVVDAVMVLGHIVRTLPAYYEMVKGTGSYDEKQSIVGMKAFELAIAATGQILATVLETNDNNANTGRPRPGLDDLLTAFQDLFPVKES